MDLIKHIEENFFAVCRYWGGLNSSLIQAGSIGAMNTGVAIADINWVWNEKPLTNDDAKSIADIKEIYKKLNLRFWWWIYPGGQSPKTSSLLQNAGLRLIEKVPCMAADLNDSVSEKQIPDNVTISPLKTKTIYLSGKISLSMALKCPGAPESSMALLFLRLILPRNLRKSFFSPISMGNLSPPRYFSRIKIQRESTMYLLSPLSEIKDPA